MSFMVKIQYNASPDNKIDKKITDILELSGTLRNETSIIDPVILIEGAISDLKNANYMYIPQFGRYYFIKNIRSIRNGIVEVTGHVDVLKTYSADVKKCKGIVQRGENTWNLYLNDGSLKVYQNPSIKTYAFPSGFDTFEFVLAVAGR